MMKCMRGKPPFTFNSLGNAAPMFITVIGLEESELPQGNTLLVTVSDLCVGGGGLNMDNKSVRFILLTSK